MIYDLLGKMTDGGGQGEVRHSNFELQPSNFRPGDFRRAVTLIELLVVISIMLLLAAYALPKLEPMAKERKIREAARSVTVFLDRARSRAIETGRPCGVIFARADNTSNAAVMLYQAEVPTPYAGGALEARMRMRNITTPAEQQIGIVVLIAQVEQGSLGDGLIKFGDKIQFNGQGPWYEIVRSQDLVHQPEFNEDANNYLIFSGPNTTVPYAGKIWIDDHFLTLRWVSNPGCVSPWPSSIASAPVSFKILRQPQRTIAQPVTLPVGTAVDLSVSGTDASPFLFSTGGDDVIVMFSPNGSIKQYSVGPTMTDATDPIFLLVGWRDNTADQKTARDQFDPANPPEFFEDDTPNWQLMTSLWIGLNTQTGLISTAENAFPQDTYGLVKLGTQLKWTDDWKTPALVESRKYARQAQSKGGR